MTAPVSTSLPRVPAAAEATEVRIDSHVEVQPLAFAELERAQPAADQPAMHLAADAGKLSNPLHGVKAVVSVCVGHAELTVGELLNAKEQQVVRLDRLVDEPVDIVLQGQVIARGHLVAVGDQFGIRISELPRPLVP